NKPLIPGHDGISAVELSRKKSPFEPLSMKLPGYDDPFAGNTVISRPEPSTGKTVAPPRPLLDCVPIPNTSVPATVAAPDGATRGSSRMTPLLSTGNIATGLETCPARLAPGGGPGPP